MTISFFKVFLKHLRGTAWFSITSLVWLCVSVWGTNKKSLYAYRSQGRAWGYGWGWPPEPRQVSSKDKSVIFICERTEQQAFLRLKQGFLVCSTGDLNFEQGRHNNLLRILEEANTTQIGCRDSVLYWIMCPPEKGHPNHPGTKGEGLLSLPKDRISPRNWLVYVCVCVCDRQTYRDEEYTFGA